VSLDLDAILRALAAKIKANIADDWNVYAWPGTEAPTLPFIELRPGPGFLQPWGTMTSSGLAEISLVLHLEVAAGNAETAFKRICRALSVGTGHDTSLIDAVMLPPRTLGGLVEDMIAAPPDAAVEWSDEFPSTTADIPVRVYARKQGAEA
jgi:hypothetical protein